MVQATKRGTEYIVDLRKRTAREYGMGNISKNEFDELYKHYDAIESIFTKISNKGE